MLLEQQLEKCKNAGVKPIAQLDNRRFSIESFHVSDTEIEVILKSTSGGAVTLQYNHDSIHKFIQNFDASHSGKPAKNTMAEIREALFDTIRGVQDGTLEISRAKAIYSASQVLINTLKVEMDYKRFNTGEPDRDIPMLDN